MPDGSALPGWPRALKEAWAAAYVSLAPSTFRALVAPQIPPIWVTDGRVAWLREDLDRWLDSRAGRMTVDPAPGPGQPPPPEGTADDDPIAAAIAAMAPKGRPRGSRQTR